MNSKRNEFPNFDSLILDGTLNSVSEVTRNVVCFHDSKTYSNGFKCQKISQKNWKRFHKKSLPTFCNARRRYDGAHQTEEIRECRQLVKIRGTIRNEMEGLEMVKSLRKKFQSVGGKVVSGEPAPRRTPSVDATADSILVKVPQIC